MAGVGDLVAHLGIDNSGFKKGLSSSTGMLRSFVGGVGALVAPAAGALAGIWGVKSSISGFQEALQGQQKLAAVLSATGNAAGLSVGQISDYAAELQATTNFEGDATVAAASMLAAFTNIRGETFFSAIDAAADLATVMGGDLQSNVELVGKALNDPTAGLAKLTKAGVSFTEQQEQQVKSLQKNGDLIGAQGILLDAIQSKFGGAAKATADPWVQLQNAIGDVGEMFGSVLLPSINVVATGLTELLQIAGGGGEFFASLGIEAAVVLSHMGGLLVLGATQWELFFVQAGLEATHFFTEVIPGYLTWFADNWQDVLFTALDYSLTIFINLGENIRELWRGVLDFLSGNPVEFNWKPLTEGAANAISSLPDIPERVVTDFEKGLQADIDSMSSSLGESMDKQRAELTEKFSPEAKVPAGVTAPELDTAAATEKKKPELKASFAGSQEAASILLRGVGGGKSMEQIASKQLTVQQQTLLATKENKPPEIMLLSLGT